MNKFKDVHVCLRNEQMKNNSQKSCFTEKSDIERS